MISTWQDGEVMMFADWPPPGTEMRVYVTQPALSATVPGVIRMDTSCFGGGIEALLDAAVVDQVVRQIAGVSAQDRERLDWTAQWTPDEPAVLRVRHLIDGAVEHVRPDALGRYRFTEDYGWRLTDGLPPLADFVVARARLRADRDGQDGIDERYRAALRAVVALGTAASEVIELAMVGLDDADRLRDRAVLTDAIAKASEAEAASREAWRRRDTN